MRDDEGIARLVLELLGEPFQSHCNISETLAARRAKMHRIARTLRETLRIVLLEPRAIVSLPFAKVDLPQRRFDDRLKIRNDERTRFKAAPHRTRVTPREAISGELLRERLALPPPFVVERQIGAPEKAALSVMIRYAVSCENDHIDEVITASVMP